MLLTAVAVAGLAFGRDAALSALGTYLGQALPGWPVLLLAFNAALALGISILLFALIVNQH